MSDYNCEPAWGAFDIKRCNRIIHVPIHMNNIARYSSDAFWKWLVDVKNKGNPFKLQIHLADVGEFEDWLKVQNNTPSPQDEP